MKTWQETQLAVALFSRKDETHAQLIASLYMPKIEMVLTSGSPASPDFTLHDSQHGFRVAEMVEILLAGGIKNLSTVEIVLLLFASYCHDIGMSPSRDRITRHYRYLLTGDNDILSYTEQSELQTWLDTYRSGITAPIDSTSITDDGLQLADDIVAYYARSRHNDWSESYIRDELSGGPEHLYPGWVDDLVTLCRSHHEGLSQLRHARFDAKMVATPSAPLNLRYLAALLRVSDILEFAPERTPSVILRQRNIAPASRIYWFKDHSISFSLDTASGSMLFSAQTPSAVVHKAVLDTAASVDAELAVCSALEQEGAFGRGSIPAKLRSNYSWGWASKLATDIRELQGRFTYIDGAFRPDTDKVLALLSGTALYGDSIVALRELLQNGLDAIREQVAHMRLASQSPSDEGTAQAIASLHNLIIMFYEDGGRYWVRCSDNGSGMTQKIIERSLLVSGSSDRGDLRRLHREAKLNSFSVGRTGQFGIGVLSYFMIADQMSFVTRRSQEAGDTDGCGWRFVSDGLDGFGELTQESRSSRGTEVTLSIRSEILGNSPKLWFTRATQYIRDVLRWSPCLVEIRDEVNKTDAIKMGPGWVDLPSSNNSELVSSAIRSHEVRKSEFVTLAEQRRASAKAEQIENIRLAAQAALRWRPEHVFNSAEKAVRLRLAIPYFDLPGGACTWFFQVDNSMMMARAGRTSGYQLKPSSKSSYHGFIVSKDRRDYSNAWVEIDYGEGRKISVDRSSFVDNGQPCDMGPTVTSISTNAWVDLLKNSSDSMYNDFNIQQSALPINSRRQFVSNVPRWALREGSSWRWQPIDRPVFSVGRLSYFEDEGYPFELEGGAAEAAWLGSQSFSRRAALHYLYGGGTLVYHRTGIGSGLIGIKWDSPEQMVVLDGSVTSAGSVFPETWPHMIAAVDPARAIYNKEHWLFALSERCSTVRSKYDVDRAAHDLKSAVSSQRSAAEFVLKNVTQARSFWKYLFEAHADVYRELLDILGVSEQKRIQILDVHDLTESDGVIDLMQITEVENGSKRLLPPPVPSGFALKQEPR